MTWLRTAPLTGGHHARVEECWTQHTEGREEQHFIVDVLRGKPFDVIGIKQFESSAERAYADRLARTAQELYDGSELQLTACPACRKPAESMIAAGEIFGIRYSRCIQCGHGFIAAQPDGERLEQLFRESEEHSSLYTDYKQAERRLTEIVQPKIEWVLDVWLRQLGTESPASAIDVGAGGGHFVEGMRRLGIPAEGFELSAASRRFGEEVFGVILSGEDVTQVEREPVDLVTFWGLLEYTPEPARFMHTASRLVKPGGLLVVEVPRFDCLSTAVQQVQGSVVARHLDPTSHVNCFSDASIATLFVEHGFAPVAAWYFGMDVYEFVVQATFRSGTDALMGQLAPWIAQVQEFTDRAYLCDDLVIAGVRR